MQRAGWPSRPSLCEYYDLYGCNLSDNGPTLSCSSRVKKDTSLEFSSVLSFSNSPESSTAFDSASVSLVWKKNRSQPVLNKFQENGLLCEIRG